jgi:transcription elongation GreA/GreB family factor
LTAVVAVSAGVLVGASGCGTETEAPGSGTPEDSVVIDVRISQGTVTPTNERIDVAVGQTVTVRVDSDADDELHVHAVPEHSFEIHPGTGQQTQFSVEVPGQVALELHETGKTVATLLVRP